ncbi:MAG: hypothetical protein WD894_21195 [Pirellulales bacterium]
MSTGTANSGSRATSSAASASALPAERERYIERQLRRTRRQVRSVELTSRLMLLAAAAVVFFLVAAVFDHWLIPGGLSVYGRLAFLAVFLLGAGWFAIRELVPLFVYRINPLFAAQTIERAKPSLKNSLLNFLMLRTNRAAVPDVVLSAVEEQAAANLQRTPLEHIVDHTRLVHLGYLLLAAVAAFCTYYLLSPKSPLQTVGRVVLPWADMQPPSRVQIDDIEPGTTTVFRGQRATVSAAVRGLQEGEAVTLYFSTADRQSVDQPVRMYVAKDSYDRHAVTLPPQTDAAALSIASAGLQQDIEYRIEAGDAVSHTHRLSVIQAPNIVVDKLAYAYPQYTGLEPETVEKSGDIKAVEGTQVTIHALANQPIASAYVDLGGDGQLKQPMKISGQRATTTLALALNEDRSAPLYSHYHVRFRTERGHENPEPIRYRIEVTPDPAPELDLLRPDKVEMAVPLNAPVPFELEASDPLYGLSDVRIIASVGGEPAFRRNRSVTKNDKSAARLIYKHAEPLDRITLDGGKKLKPGDVIEYWAEAVDNKTPKPNVTKTDVRKLVIVEPQREQNPNQQPQENNQGEGQANENQQDANRDEQKNQQNDQKNNQQPNERGGKGDPANNEAQDNKSDGSKGDGNKGQPQPNDNQQPQPGDNNQQRKGNEPNPKDAQGEQRNENDRGREEQQPPQNNVGDKGQKNDQTNAGKGQEPNADQKNADGDAKNNNQPGGQKSPTAQDPRGGKDNQRGDPSNDGAAGEQRNERSDRSNDAQGNADHKQAPTQDEQRPVPQSDEGEAFNRILDHAKKEGKSPDQSEPSDGLPRPSPNDRGPEQDKSDNAGAKGDESQPPSDRKKGENIPGQSTDQQGDERSTAEAQKDEGANDGQPKASPQKTQDEGAKTGEDQNDQNAQGERGDEKGGSTPAPQEQARPNNNRPPADSANSKSEQQEKSPAHSKNTSNTKGEKSGDRSGRGEDGGGMNDNRAGSGAQGASDPANEGANAAKEPGAGETGNKSGEDKTASGKTSKSGTEKGDGSKFGSAADNQKKADKDRNATSRPGAEAKDGGEDATEQELQRGKADEKKGAGGEGKNQDPSDQAGPKDGQNGKQEAGKAQRGDQPGDAKDSGGKAPRGKQSPDGRGQGTPTGGGGTPDGDAAEPPDFQNEQPTDDKANLDYSKRATDLALDHLRNQLKDGQPDQDLLDRLGWSKDDLQKLLTRWEKMQREAKQPGPTGVKAKDNLQDAIQSLGWKRPGQASRKASAKADDSARGLRDAARSAPPPEYKEAFEAFQKRTSRGD